jgi:uncharacterized repeat protein (TIGR01451 family)
MRRVVLPAVLVLALLGPASASAAILVGSDLSLAPTNATAQPTATLVQTVKRNSSSVPAATPSGGVLVNLKFAHGPIAGGNHGFAFRILKGTSPVFTARPATPDGSAANTVTIDGADNPGIETYAPTDAAGDPMGIPIVAGERVALVAPGDVNVFYNGASATGGDYAFRTSSHDSGQLAYSDGENSSDVLVQGTIETDIDSDKYGDETQDSCKTDATVHKGPCPADVSITKTADRATGQTGKLIYYTIKVTNGSTTAPATGVVVTDTLPAGATVHSMSADQGTCSGTTTVTCAIGTIDPKVTRTVEVVIKTGQAGVTTNTASVGSDNDPTPANNSASATTNVTDPPDKTAPVLGSAKLSNKKFAVDTKGAAEPLVKAAKKKKAPKKGTKFTYTLDEPGEVRFVISQKLPGYLFRPGSCVGTNRPIPANRKCTRLVERGRFVQAGVLGKNSKKWSGRLGKKTPPPGSYQATLTVVDAAGNRSKKPVVLSFTIVKP